MYCWMEVFDTSLHLLEYALACIADGIEHNSTR